MLPATPNDRCETCCFFAEKYYPNRKADVGLCHRRAPILDPAPINKGGGTQWPTVERRDWCGDYSRDWSKA